MSFFGLPPFFPFLRAAAALASDVALPPRRPRATAAGFFRLLTADLKRGLAQLFACGVVGWIRSCGHVAAVKVGQRFDAIVTVIPRSHGRQA